MRHRVKGRKLSRTASHRKATMRALAIGLIHSVTEANKKNYIVTTVEKAKELRGFIEPLVTRAKVDSHHNRKEVFSSLQDKYATTILFDEIGPKAKDRPGGYIRIIKAGFRQGDGAETAIVEFVDYNDVKPEGQTTKKKRTRRSGKAKAAEQPAATPVAEEVVEQAEETTAEVEAPVEEAVVEETATAEEVTEETVAEETPAEETEAETEVTAEEAATEESADSEEESDEEKK